MTKPQTLADQPVEWRSIDTAPRGGEWFFARTIRDTIRYVHFADKFDRFPTSHDGMAWETDPIEWTIEQPSSPFQLERGMIKQCCIISNQGDEMMGALDIALGLTSFVFLGMTVRQWTIQKALHFDQALGGTFSFFGSVWFIARLFGAS